MKNTKKLLSLVLALVMLLGVVAPLSVFAEAPVGDIKETDIQDTKPNPTPVIVHKLQADSYTGVPDKGYPHNGGKLDQTQLDKLGTNVKELDGVTFTYYKLTDYTQFKKFLDAPGSYNTTKLVEAQGLTKAGTITTAGGQGATASLTEDGYYWFVESKKPDTVSSSIAVPFGISIPVMNQIKVGDHEPGTVYLKTVHVYPKNVTGTEPTPKKTVGNEVNMNESHNVGDPQKWYLQATIPANIADYEKFILNDVFFKGLTYKGNVKVYLGYDGITSGEVSLTGGTDYTIVQPAVDKHFTKEIDSTTEVPADEKFSITLTEAGIKKLAANYQTVKDAAKGKEVKLYATVDTVINEDAKMGTNIPNTFDLTFKTKSGEDKNKKPDTPPTVNTGGKKFVKVSESEVTKTLAGAVFELYDGKTQIKWTQALIDANQAAITAGKFASDANGTTLTAATVGQPIYLMSDANGLFEIKGLEYSSWKKTKLDGSEETITHDYKIKEVKFPKGYAGNKGETIYNFTVDANSYNGGPKETHDAQGNMLVKNKDLTIPPTGGIGTAIFGVAGIALMGGAFAAIKKRSAEEE
ncbi:SpaH/EbpB family LPXTG-anchored major pilin [Peptoniphilus catoniae]|uniref:SpaH/EbpB family LPXTG-anchored major pilin n=1 Tax=Peptoniphilus catoniae TaxID=1660341 RepID=UPI0010FED3B4|nr:SpaH/EbpB family LPXTG-anchored major pilin [Peptoniphilus catoniae]